MAFDARDDIAYLRAMARAAAAASAMAMELQRSTTVPAWMFAKDPLPIPPADSDSFALWLADWLYLDWTDGMSGIQAMDNSLQRQKDNGTLFNGQPRLAPLLTDLRDRASAQSKPTVVFLAMDGSVSDKEEVVDFFRTARGHDIFWAFIGLERDSNEANYYGVLEDLAKRSAIDAYSAYLNRTTYGYRWTVQRLMSAISLWSARRSGSTT